MVLRILSTTTWQGLHPAMCFSNSVQMAGSTVPSEIALPPGTLIRYKPLGLPPFFRAKAWRIVYATRDYAGRPIAASGMVLLIAAAIAGLLGIHFANFAVGLILLGALLLDALVDLPFALPTIVAGLVLLALYLTWRIIQLFT